MRFTHNPRLSIGSANFCGVAEVFVILSGVLITPRAFRAIRSTSTPENLADPCLSVALIWNNPFPPAHYCANAPAIIQLPIVRIFQQPITIAPIHDFKDGRQRGTWSLSPRLSHLALCILRERRCPISCSTVQLSKFTRSIGPQPNLLYVHISAVPCSRRSRRHKYISSGHAFGPGAED